MTSFASSSLRFLRRLVGAGGDRAPQSEANVVLDGISAVALTETRIAEAASLGATFPAARGARLWAQHAAEQDRNEFGTVISALETGDARSALAGALGLSMSGRRATVFLSGPDLLAAQDLIALAAGRHVPLVAHLACRAVPGHAQALGTGHEAYHATSDRGLFQLFAINAQEAVDLAIIARRVAERALVPGIVAMDAEQTALAAQDIDLPDETTVRAYLPEPSRMIETPTHAQRMIFGDMRRQVPCSFDLDRPMLLSPLQGPESFALGAAGTRPFFLDSLPECLAEAFDAFAECTGRHYDGIVEHETAGADIVLVVQGSAFETVAAFVDHARRHLGLKIGALGIRSLRPLPADKIVDRLARSRIVAVLERTDSALADEGPLLREVRSAFERTREPAPPRRARDRPRFVSVPFGIGGLPLRAADLAALAGELSSSSRSLLYLGLDFVRDSSAYPKQQALMDALRRTYEHLDGIGVRSSEPPPDIRPRGATTIAFHRRAGRVHEALPGEAAALIHEAVGGHMRSRPAMTWQRFGEPCVDVLTHATQALRDPGDDVAIDIAVIAADAIDPKLRCTERLAEGGVLVTASHLDEGAFVAALPEHVRRDLAEGRCALELVPLEGTAGKEAAGRTEALLGGLLAAFLARSGQPDEASAAKIRATREPGLRHLPEEAREQRLDAFEHGFTSIARVEVPRADLTSADEEAFPPTTPTGMHGPRAAAGAIDDVSRFSDHVGVFYREGRTEELSAHPALTVGEMPPASSTLRSVSDDGAPLPIFDPATCDGDPALWTSCPDGSIVPLVISARALIDAGIDLAAGQGKRADTLRGVAGQLARRANKVVSSSETPLATVGAVLLEAFERMSAKTDADADRRAALKEAVDGVVEVIGALPVARTEVFFDEPERQAPGSGELFSLVVNVDACKAPDVVLAACAGRGIRAIEPTPQSLEAARRLYRLWQELPDTSGATIERVRTDPRIGALAAVMLSRHCLQAMAGGDGAEPGSGAKLALRHVLGLAEFHLQPRQQKLISEIDALRGTLAERIEKTLSDALPTGNLDALAGGLDLLGRDDVNLAELSQSIDSAVTTGRVDGAQLTRLVDLARALADLRWRLAAGPNGQGRARTGLVVAPGAVDAWAGAFPYNPFSGPVVIDACGETAPLAMGLLEGQLREVMAGFLLLRRAKRELESSKPTDADTLASLRFTDLTDEERATCPPMLVVGDGRSLGGRGLSGLAWLLNSGLPVKIIALSGAAGKIDGGLGTDALGAFPAEERFDLALLALLARRAYVVQTSIADRDHFAGGVLNALAFDGPAFVHMHGPSPERHGFEVRRLFDQARLALEARAFPLLTFDPTAEGVFGACLDISSNPCATSRWVLGADDTPVTPIDWAVTEQRFAEHFRPAEGSGAVPAAIAEYLDLPPAERLRSRPFVAVGAEKLLVDDALIEDAQERLDVWRTLQELAGIVTPFTATVRADAQRDVAEAHRKEIEALTRKHESRIAQLRAEFEAEATSRVTSGLMALAGYAESSIEEAGP